MESSWLALGSLAGLGPDPQGSASPQHFRVLGGLLPRVAARQTNGPRKREYGI